MSVRIAIVTQAEVVGTGIDVDEPLLAAALEARGAEPELWPWERGAEGLEHVALAVVRSTWNYHLHLPAFLQFLDAAATRTTLVNPLAALRMNVHKGYLLGLSAAGVPVIPTTLVPQASSAAGSSGALPAGPLVIKPAVSGGAWETRFFEHGDEAAHAFLAASVSARDTLVQPWLPGFASPGELNLVWIDGEVMHGVRKRPPEGLPDQAVTPLAHLDPAAVALAHAAVATLPPGCVYVRIDMVPHEGSFLVSELEATEPSLYLREGSGASVARFADALVRHAQ